MRADRERGSALVEAMVAVAVMSGVLVVATRAVGDGARRTLAVERTSLAELEARSRLDEVGADIALAPGVSSGVDGAFAWTVSVAPAPAGEAAVADPRLMDVQVEVSEGGRPAFTLRSLRIAPGPPA